VRDEGYGPNPVNTDQGPIAQCVALDALCVKHRWRTRMTDQAGDMSQTSTIKSDASPDTTSTALAVRRTGMAFERTRMATDRTLMSVMRTSLSPIGFGFTIFQFFERAKIKSLLPSNEGHAPRNFGLALVYLGVGILIVGVIYHIQFMLGLRRSHRDMTGDGLFHAESHFPVSYTLIVAILLLLFGLAVAESLTFRVGPFA